MDKNICDRCKRNNHSEDECMSKTDINGNEIANEVANEIANEVGAEYTHLIVKDRSILGRIIEKINDLKKGIKKILEVPLAGDQINK
jgi:hypothetical protein